MNYLHPFIKTFLLSVLLATITSSATAIPVKLPFSALDHELITDIQIGPDNRTWISSTKGIFVYDGTDLYRYRRDQSATTSVRSFVTSLRFTTDGTVIGGSGNGIFVYDPLKDSFIERTSQISFTHMIDPLPDGSFLVIDGNTGSIMKTDSTLTTVIKQEEFMTTSLYLIHAKLSNGNYVVCQDNTFLIFSPELDIIQKGQIDSEITHITDALGRILFSTQRGIEAVSYSGQRVSLPMGLSQFTNQKNIRFVTDGTEGFLMIGVADEGIYAYNTDDETYRLHTEVVDGEALNSHSVLLGSDAAHSLWISNQHKSYLGASIVRLEKRYHNAEILYSKNDYPDRGEILDVSTDSKGTIYLLTTRGIFCYEDQIGIWQFVASVPTTGCTSLSFDSHGNMFVGSLFGIYIYNMSNGKPKLVRCENIKGYFSIQQAKTPDYMFFASPVELVYFDKQLNASRIELKGSGRSIVLWPEIEENSVGVRSENNYCALFNPVSGIKETQGDDNVIYEENYKIRDRQGRILTATDGHGVIISDPARKGDQDTLNVMDGLPDNTVYSLAEASNGHILIITTNGMAEYDPSAKTVIDHGELGDMLFNLAYGHMHQASDSTIYAFSADYLLRIDPNLKYRNVVPIAPILLKADINGMKHMGPVDRIEVNHDENDIQINFISVDMNQTGIITYEYLLSGYENTWHSTLTGTALYHDLPPGDFKLMLRSRFTPEHYSDITRIPITIIPAFYQTLWFRLLVILMICAVVVLFVIFLIHTKVRMAEYQFKVEKERMKVDLYTNLSHLIRTPVSLINAPFKELVKERTWTREESQLIDVIDRNIAHIMDLTQQFLARWSTSDETNDPADSVVKIKQKDLSAIVRETALVFRPTAKVRSINLQLSTPESLVVPTDEDKIVKILYNLVSNAIKYTPDGGTVTIEARPAESAYCLSVIDTGRGVPDSMKERIFNRFFRASLDIASTESFGIGLHHTQQLVEILNGTIEVLDNHPTGTIFALKFPIDSNYTVEDIPAESSRNQQIDDIPLLFETNNEKEKLHLLIVEDNEEMLNYLSLRLCNNYQVTKARDGMEALTIFDNEVIDMVVTDVMMPRMDGYALCRWIKESPEHCHIPVLILTAKSAITDELEGMGCGADAYVKKPFEMDILQAMLANLVENRRKVQSVLMRRLHAIPPSAVQEVEEPVMDESESIEAEQTLNEKDSRFLQRLNELLEVHLNDEQYGVMEMCKDMGFSKTNLYKKIRALTGSTPNQLLADFRFSKVEEMMMTGNYTLSEIAYNTGFSSNAAFSRKFHAVYGISPSEFMKKNIKK